MTDGQIREIVRAEYAMSANPDCFFGSGEIEGIAERYAISTARVADTFELVEAERRHAETSAGEA